MACGKMKDMQRKTCEPDKRRYSRFLSGMGNARSSFMFAPKGNSTILDSSQDITPPGGKKRERNSNVVAQVAKRILRQQP